MSLLLSRLALLSPSPTHVHRFVHYSFVSIPSLHIGSLNFSIIEFNFPPSVQHLSLSLSPTKDFLNSVSSVWAQFVQQKRGVYLFSSVSTTECGGRGIEERKGVRVCVCVCVFMCLWERFKEKGAPHMTQQSHFWAYTLRKPALKETHAPQCSLQHCLS